MANYTSTIDPTIPASGSALSSAPIRANFAAAKADVTALAALVGSGSGITGLTGDVTASGLGNATATLANTAVMAGSYTNANITVDSKGRVIAAQSGTSSSGGITSITGDGTAGSNGILTVTKINGVTPAAVATSGSYNDLTGKPVLGSAAALTAGAANGAATLDSTGKVLTAQLPASSSAVTSVAGRTGAVTLTASDISGLSTAGTTTGRTVCSTSNFLPYTNAGQTARYLAVRKKDTFAENADWSNIHLKFSNFSRNNTSLSTSYPAVILRLSIEYNGVLYPATFATKNEILVIGGQTVETDNIVMPPGLAGTEFARRLRVAYPLLIKSKTVSFQVGEVVTGGTSGATGTVAYVAGSGSTGALTLTSETGTFADSEALSGSLGGAALVDLVNSQSTLITIGTQAIWNEGAKGVSAAVDPTTTDPVRYPTYTASVSSGTITGVNKIDAGIGWGSTTAPSMAAWEEMPDGTIQSKNIGYGNLGSDGISSGYVSDSSPVSSAYPWVNPKIVFTGGNGFGVSTATLDCCLTTGIPSRPVKSVRLRSDSVGRGYSAADSRGDRRHNFGSVSRSIYNRVGIINDSYSGAAVGNELQYNTTFALANAVYNGIATYSEIALGSNDITGGSTKASVEGGLNALAAYERASGALASFATIIPRNKPMTITGITLGTTTTIQAVNSLSAGDPVLILYVGGTTQLNNNTYTVASTTPTSFVISVNSTGFGTYTSGGNAYNYTNPAAQIPEVGFSIGGIADQLNLDLLNGVLATDFPVVNRLNARLRSSVVTSAFIGTLQVSDDLIHPSLLGMAYAFKDPLYRAEWNNLLVANTPLATNDDFLYADPLKGPILTSPNGTRYRLTAPNGGGTPVFVAV